MTSKDNTQPNASTARDTGNASAQYITWGTATPINYLSLVTILTPALFTLYDKIHRNDSLHGLTVHQECLAARLYPDILGAAYMECTSTVAEAAVHPTL